MKAASEKNKSVKREIVILGAGPTGLTLAKELSKEFNVTVIEKENYVGGLSSSFEYKNMVLDFGPHKFYTQLDGINDYFKSTLGKDTLTVTKRNSLRLFGKYFSFPIQPAQLVKNLTPGLFWKGIKIGFSYAINIPNAVFNRYPKNYEEYLVKGFGRQGYNFLFRDIAIKLWGIPTELSVELAKKRVPVSGIPQLVKSVLFNKKDKSVSAEFFYYPKKGFVQLLTNMREQAQKNGAKFVMSSKIKKMDLKGTKATIELDHKKIEADIVISTIPLKDSINYLSESPKPVKKAVDSLNYKGLVIAYLFVEKEKVLNDNWVFFLQGDTFINRIAELKSFSNFMFPKNKTALTVEITRDDILGKKDEEIKKLVLNEIEKTNLLKKEDVSEIVLKRFKNVYPVYDLNYKENLNTVLDFLDSHENFYTIGRAGLFNYNNVDHCVDMALKLSNHIKSDKNKTEWKKNYAYFDTYKIVD